MKSSKQLPARAQLDQLKRQAKELLADYRAGNREARDRARECHPRFRSAEANPSDEALRLADAQLVIAREYGFSTWTELRRRVETIDLDDPTTAFIQAACIALDGSSDREGDLEHAEALRRKYPDAIGCDVFTAAILGDDHVLPRLLAAAPDAAGEPGGLYDWDPLTYLCFSKYLRLDKARSEAFVRSARLLLDHGASANTGFFWQEHAPLPSLYGVTYGAAALAQHPELTRLLLERGADPNDGETAYHVAEGYDNRVLQVLVESGKLNHGSVVTLLHRKLDWHDYDAIKWLLERGADPNKLSWWGRASLHQAVDRDNALRFFELLLDYGADPTLLSHEAESGYYGDPSRARFARPRKSAIALAARAGRGDVLELFERRGFAIELSGIERLLAACATHDTSAIQAICEREPETRAELVSKGVDFLIGFAATGNTDGVRGLLDLGVDVAGSREHETALHAAAWMAHHTTVVLLIQRGAPVDARNRKGDTPLGLAVRACVDTYWTHRRSPDSVRALLEAGANVAGVDRFPSGYAEVDELLRAYGR